MSYLKLTSYFRAVVAMGGIIIMSTSSLLALAVGGAGGVDFPFAHGERMTAGPSAEGFYRIDPYEIRFHFSDTDVHSYSVTLGLKHFFTNTVARPYLEAAIGPQIVHSEGKGMAYGVRPEVSVGVDLGVSDFLSVGAVTRYYAQCYFGNTYSGWMEANHGLSLMGNVVFWF